MRGCFITATGTDVGKTLFTRALALSARADGLRVAALKPLETGWDGPAGSDAQALAAACGVPELAAAPGFYRAKPPLAPAAVPLAGGPAAPPPAALADAVRSAARGYDATLVEGAGGLLVPLDDEHTVADLAVALALPLVLLAPDALGVLSYVLTAAEAAQSRGLSLRAVVLVQRDQLEGDCSPASNARVLEARLPCPVHRFGRAPITDDGLERFAAGVPWLRSLYA